MPIALGVGGPPNLLGGGATAAAINGDASAVCGDSGGGGMKAGDSGGGGIKSGDLDPRAAAPMSDGGGGGKSKSN